MIHQYIKGKSDRTLVVLHGTGGNEHDLIPLSRMIDPDAGILSPRGNVLEQGMPRFFKRLSAGVFDLESLEIETKRLYEFIKSSSNTYGFDIKKTVAIGYSNGANILASLLMTYDLCLKSAIMMHPMVTKQSVMRNDHRHTTCLITAGENDLMVPREMPIELSEILAEVGYASDIHFFNQGHNVSQQEMTYIKKWYEKGL